MHYMIAVDIGTTGTKAALFDGNGRIFAQDYRRYATFNDGMKVEQSPEDWWNATAAAIKTVVADCDRSRVAALMVSGQMQNLIPVGNSASALSNAILYSDTRAYAEMEAVERTLGRETLIRITGNLQDASSLIAKLLWLKKNDADLYNRSRCILFGSHGYVTFKLTGRRSCDLTTASTTGLLDIANNAWAYDMLKGISLRTDILPELVETGSGGGYVGSLAAAETGLPEGLPVFHGCGDVGSNTIGSNAGVAGGVSCYIGTSGWLAMTTNNLLADPEKGIYNLRHPDPSKIIQVGPMLLAGGAVDWIIESIGHDTGGSAGYEAFAAEAALAEAGSGGVVFLPYLSGERAPFRDAGARGAFIGISRTTTKADLYRSVMEGVAFGMKSIYDSGSASALHAKSITFSGGGSKSAAMGQILADVFGCGVNVPEHSELVGLIGSYILSANAMGWFSGQSVPDGLFPLHASYKPQEANRKRYELLYPVFLSLYPTLRESFQALRMFRERS